MGALIAVVAALTLAGAVTVWHIYVAVALLGVLQALNQPARVTTLSDLVGQGALLDAIAQFNAAVHIGRIVGPPVVGLLIDGVPFIADRYDIWGTGAGLIANAAFYGASVIFLLPMSWTSSAAAPAREPLFRNFINGLSVIKNSPVLLTVIVLACSFGGFGMSHLQVVPVFAKDQLGADATQRRANPPGLRASAHCWATCAVTFMHREPGSTAGCWCAWLSWRATLTLPSAGRTSFWLAWGLVRNRGRGQPRHGLASGDNHPPALDAARTARAG